MRRFVLILALSATPFAQAAWACDGPNGGSVAIANDGSKYTVTNVGRVPLQVTFSAYGTTYSLQLAPGQSGTPITSGVHQQYMTGYQTCYAASIAPVPARR